MAGIKLVGSKTVRMDDFSEFDPGAGLELVDIVNDASLEKPEDTFVSAPGSFLYEMSIDVDMRRVSELSVESVLVEFFQDNPVVPKSMVDSVKDRSDRAKSSFSMRKELLENQLQKPIASATLFMDLSRTVRSTLAVPGNSADFLVTEKLKLDSPVACQDNSYATPVFVAPAPKAMMGSLSSIPNQSAASLRRDNLRRFGVDPAKTNSIPLPLYPTLPSISKNALTSLASGGIKPVSPSLNPRHFNGARVSLRALRDRLKPQQLNDSFASKSVALAAAAGQSSVKHVVENKPSIAGFDPRVVKINDGIRVLAHEITVQSYIKTMKAVIEVPKEFSRDKNLLYLRLTPKIFTNVSNTVVIPSLHPIRHRENVNELMMPTFAPKLEAVQNLRGQVSFRLTQVDPAATSVTVMKKVVTKNLRDDGRFEVLGDYTLEYHDKSIVVEDKNANNFDPNSVIYRAVAKYSDLSGPFESIVFGGQLNPPGFGVNAEPDGVSIVATNEKQWIKVEISGIPERAVSLRLLRENLDGPGSVKDRTVNIRNESNEHTTFTINGNGELTFYDRSAINDRQYRYFCVLNMRGGSQITSSEDELIIRKFSANDMPLEANLSDLQVLRQDDGTYSVGMNLNVEFKDSSFQFIKEILRQQGADEAFISELDNNRDEIRNAALFRVERIDRLTGRRVKLGTFQPGAFLDDTKLAEKLSVPSLEQGGRHLYLFRLCLVPPSAIVSGVFNELSSGRTPGVKDVKFLANKFNNPLISRKGVLPSVAKLAKGFDPDLLLIQGDTGISLQQDVQVPERRPIVSDIKYKETSKGNLVTWQITDGDASVIDEFRVGVYINGRYESLPSVAYGNTKGMYCIDDRFHQELGTKYYVVSVVYYDGAESVEASSTSIFKKSDSVNVLNKINKSGTLTLGTTSINPNAGKKISTVQDLKNLL
jgi:hypothetical protein